ncbi:MAG: hypothetical protein JF599_12335 [Verrucomicrobia bacterium]|nr:hypothetical protein [Verrucomicrobiota bacterium]
MNRFYIIVPVVLLGLFGGVYWQHTQEAEKQAREKAVAVAQAKAAEEAKKAAADRQSREDTDKRAAARLAEDKKKEAEKRAKWDADSAHIAEDTARYTSQADESSKQVTALEKQLADLRASKKTLNEEAFSAAHDVEALLIQRRSAEMEIQRTTEMVAHKAAGVAAAP